MRTSLPVEGISLILAKDLAGEKVMVDPREVGRKVPRYIPSHCGNTFNKGKKEAIKEQGMEEIGLSGTFLENIEGTFEERKKEKAEKSLV